jgi:hypothetical protein
MEIRRARTKKAEDQSGKQIKQSKCVNGNKLYRRILINWRKTST